MTVSGTENLTSLYVQLESDVGVTFPAGLKELRISEGTLANTNTGEAALESFESEYPRRITRDELERLKRH